MEHIERVQRELKYKGTILSMYADTIKVPNGNTAVWDFIGHQGQRQLCRSQMTVKF